MSDAPAFPFDDPAWDSATDAFGNGDTRDLIQEITDSWDDETADYLLFSALLHQGTTYSATFLALPHIVRLAKTAPANALPMIETFLGGVALHGQLPSTSGGVSLAAAEPWAATPTGQLAAASFHAQLPAIARITEAAFLNEPHWYLASGLAAALGYLALSNWLTSGENGGFLCTSCKEDNEWLLIGDEIAVYKGQFSLDDWNSARPDHASSIAEQTPPAVEVESLRRRLGPCDPITAALLAHFTATATCASCGLRQPLTGTDHIT